MISLLTSVPEWWNGYLSFITFMILLAWASWIMSKQREELRKISECHPIKRGESFLHVKFIYDDQPWEVDIDLRYNCIVGICAPSMYIPTDITMKWGFKNRIRKTVNGSMAWEEFCLDVRRHVHSKYHHN